MALLQQGWFALLVSLGESAPFVILGLLLAGLVREFIPATTLEKRLGGFGIAPVLRAVGLGALLPICSCSTIPLGLGMARSGASNGTVLAFMTSAPALSPVTIVLGLSLLGPTLLGSYALSVLCGSCLIGVVGNSLLGAWGDVPGNTKHCGCGCNHQSLSTSGRLSAAVRWAIFDLGSEVSLSLLAGLIVATVLLVFTPDDWVIGLVGQPGPIAILSVILLALPAYTCSVPALLIAGSLLAKGAAPGVAVAFLIAGPATNFGELNSIRVGLGVRTAGFYFLSVTVLAVTVAIAISQIPLPNTPYSQSTAAQSSHDGHRHLHFDETSSDIRESDLSDRFIATWRWPFVCVIGFLACHSLLRLAFKVRTVSDTSQETLATIVDGPTFVVPDIQTSEG